MSKQVTLTIDGQEVIVPEGALIVDAARKIGVDIPVFCYHPKMEPVGMCRMCLVDIGRPVIDRATGQPVREADGSLKIQFGLKLETACTTPVSDGMVVIGMSDKVQAARKDIIEFILTSHPLDCPVCDKGGECPLQNLTIAHGPGQSRYLYDEKMHLAKHVPLGELIYLDRERCIQCGRCVRFQSEVVGDPVIGFYHRGRSLEIATFSDPGFDSVFSGNTTDICPVGALTTADFRFGARPWELKAAASICSHCPVGCNITFNVRREVVSGGNVAIKRAMPRQNEAVNEIWICDKGRFAYHYTESAIRLTTPLVRRQGELVPATWDEALQSVVNAFRDVGQDLLTLASGRLSNEDLFNLRLLSEGLKSRSALYTQMAGGDLVAQFGPGPELNLSALGKGAVIAVVASDLQAEAPIWFLRLKQAVRRGATLIVVNPRPTPLDCYATHIVRYQYGEEAQTVSQLQSSSARSSISSQRASKTDRTEWSAVADVFAKAEKVLVFYGSEGLGIQGSGALAQECANLLTATAANRTLGQTGKPNHGLVAVWQKVNEQGAWEIGWRPPADVKAALQAAKAIYVVAADPVGDDPTLREPINEAGFVVVQDLYLTETALLADVVLPAQAYTERDGTYTSGERRVQRFYPAVLPRAGCRPDFAITAQIALALRQGVISKSGVGQTLEGQSAGSVFAQIAAKVAVFAGLSYRKLAETSEQRDSLPPWPMVGRGNLYYGGAAYENKQGLGVQLAPAASPVSASLSGLNVGQAFGKSDDGKLLAVPVTRLYDRGQTVRPSELLRQRIGDPAVVLNRTDAARLGLADAAQVILTLNGFSFTVQVKLDASVPTGVVLVPRSFGLPTVAPALVEVRPVEKAPA